MNYNKTNWVRAGDGDEADVLKGVVTQIEGIGGIVAFKSPITVAKRTNWNKPIYEYEGHDLFCKNLALSILDWYFLKAGRYLHNHIPAPLGSFNGGYYYEFVEGSEGFPTQIIEEGSGRVIKVQLDEWNVFSGLFDSFGFDAGQDIVVESGTASKNIIISGWDINELYETGKLNSDWKRIDFGPLKQRFDYRKFVEQMRSQKVELARKMGERYDTALLAAKYWGLGGNLPSEESKKLEELVLQFRREEAGTWL